MFVTPWGVEDELQNKLGLSGTDNPLSQAVRQTVPLDLLPLDVDREPLSPKHFAPRRIGPMEIRTGKLGGGAIVWLNYRDLYLKNNTLTIMNSDPWRHYVATVALTPFVEDDDLYYDYYFSIWERFFIVRPARTRAYRFGQRRPSRRLLEKRWAALRFPFTSPRRERKDASACSIVKFATAAITFFAKDRSRSV